LWGRLPFEGLNLFLELTAAFICNKSSAESRAGNGEPLSVYEAGKFVFKMGVLYTTCFGQKVVIGLLNTMCRVVHIRLVITV